MAAAAALALAYPQKLLDKLTTRGEESEKLLRSASVVFLGGQGLLSVIMPGLILGFYGAGFFSGGPIADMFQPLGIVMVILAYIYYCSGEWSSGKAKQDIVFAITAYWMLCALWNVVAFFFGDIGFLVIFNLPINGLFAILHLKQLEIM